MRVLVAVPHEGDIGRSTDFKLHFKASLAGNGYAYTGVVQVFRTADAWYAPDFSSYIFFPKELEDKFTNLLETKEK